MRERALTDDDVRHPAETESRRLLESFDGAVDGTLLQVADALAAIGVPA
jgi:hypothetical protein